MHETWGIRVMMGSQGVGLFQPFSNRYSVHEILHSIGLPHPGSYDLDTGDLSDQLTCVDDAEYLEDSTQYTVMSYFGG